MGCKGYASHPLIKSNDKKIILAAVNNDSLRVFRISAGENPLQ